MYVEWHEQGYAKHLLNENERKTLKPSGNKMHLKSVDEIYEHAQNLPSASKYKKCISILTENSNE